MREIIICLLFIIHFNLSASVYDFIKDRIDFSMPFISKEIKKMNIRINGNRMDISLLESNKSSEEVLAELYKKAENNGSDFFNNENVFYVANLLYEIAGRKKYEEEFGYIFYKEKNNKICFIITAGDGSKSEIIKISSILNKNGVGYDDGIKHMTDAQKIFSVEILSDFNTTIYFANFYSVAIADKYEIRNFYESSLKKSGFKIIKTFFYKETEFFIFEKKTKKLPACHIRRK